MYGRRKVNTKGDDIVFSLISNFVPQIYTPRIP